MFPAFNEFPSSSSVREIQVLYEYFELFFCSCSQTGTGHQRNKHFQNKQKQQIWWELETRGIQVSGMHASACTLFSIQEHTQTQTMECRVRLGAREDGERERENPRIQARKWIMNPRHNFRTKGRGASHFGSVYILFARFDFKKLDGALNNN